MLDSNENKESWWSGWVQSAKEKSENVFNFVKHDLSEFTSTMQNDVAYVKEKLTQENASAASEKVKQGMTNILGGLSKALIIRPHDDHDSEMIQIVDGQPVVFDRIKARLHALQIDPATYIVDPDGINKGKYDHFVTSQFDLENLKGEISELLVNNVHVRSIYTQLVPITVLNVDFWRRYFFKKQQLDEDELRRSQIIKRVDEVHKEELGWDEELEDISPKSAKDSQPKSPFMEPLKTSAYETASSPSVPIQCSTNGTAQLVDAHIEATQLVGSLTDQSDVVASGQIIATGNEVDTVGEDKKQDAVELSLDNKSKDTDGAVGVDKKEDKVEKGIENKGKAIGSIDNDKSDAKENASFIQGNDPFTDTNREINDHRMESFDLNKESGSVEEDLQYDSNLSKINVKPLSVSSDLATQLASSNSNRELLLVEICAQSSSSNSPTSWTNLSTGINSKETNSEQASPVESDANDKSDGLADDWEKDFDETLSEDTTAIKSSVNIQILSNPNPSAERSEDWEDW